MIDAPYPAHGDTSNWDAELYNYIQALPTQAGPFKDALEGSIAAATPLPQFSGLLARLDAGLSAAVGTLSDSTGASDGSSPASDLYLTGFVRRLAAANPSHHVRVLPWDPATNNYGAPVVMQAAAGRRYANSAGRSLRYVPPAGQGAFTVSGGNMTMDLRRLVDLSDWTPTSEVALMARRVKINDAGTGLDAAEQFRWVLKPDGHMRWGWSPSGNYADFDYHDSTVAVPGTPGTPLWVRVTGSVTTGGAIEVKFYTSPANSGAVWTQLGTTVGFGGPVSGAVFASTGFFEIDGEGWQPIGSPLFGKSYEVQIRDGIDGPTIAPCLPEDWEIYGDGSTSFGGSPTLTLVNGAAPGRNLDYFNGIATQVDGADTKRLGKMTPDYGQSVLIVNDGHNEGSASGLARWTERYKIAVSAARARLPLASVVAIGQNPHTVNWEYEAEYGSAHRQRIAELAALAAQQGWGFVNLYAAFLDAEPSLATLISNPDGLHPTPSGYAFGADVLALRAGVPA